MRNFLQYDWRNINPAVIDENNKYGTILALKSLQLQAAIANETKLSVYIEELDER